MDKNSNLQQNPPLQQKAVVRSAWLMEIYDNSHTKEPKRIGAMEYPSKEAEKVKKKIDKGGTKYSYKLLY
jgi:hypothetical protein